MSPTNTVVLVLVLGIPMVVLIWALSKWLNKPRENHSELSSALRKDGSFWLEPEKIKETWPTIPQQEEKKDEVAQHISYPRKVKIWERWIAGFFIIWVIFLVIYIIQSDAPDLWKRPYLALNQSKEFLPWIAVFVTAVLAIDWAADKATRVLEIYQGRLGIIAKIAALTGVQYLLIHNSGILGGISLWGQDDDLGRLVGNSLLVIIGLWLLDKIIQFYKGSGT